MVHLLFKCESRQVFDFEKAMPTPRLSRYQQVLHGKIFTGARVAVVGLRDIITFHGRTSPFPGGLTCASAPKSIAR
jgi:hypothetical protein